MKFGLTILLLLLVIIGIGFAWLAFVDTPVQQQEIIVNVPVGAQ